MHFGIQFHLLTNKALVFLIRPSSPGLLEQEIRLTSNNDACNRDLARLWDWLRHWLDGLEPRRTAAALAAGASLTIALRHCYHAAKE